METETHDSAPETRKHIQRVRDLLMDVRGRLHSRALDHDQTKLGPNEKPAFDTLPNENLKTITFGSDEYRKILREHLSGALAHHYEHNSHHPEHYPNGVDDMSLLDLVEMMCDWKAAGERHSDSSMAKSIEKNTERFHLSPQLVSILKATAREMDWQ